MRDIEERDGILYYQIKNHFQDLLSYIPIRHERQIKETVFVQEGSREEYIERQKNLIQTFEKIGEYLNLSNAVALKQLPDAILVEIGRGLSFLEDRADIQYNDEHLNEELFELKHVYKNNEDMVDEIENKLEQYNYEKGYFQELAALVGKEIRSDELRNDYYNGISERDIIELIVPPNVMPNDREIDKELQLVIDIKLNETKELFNKIKDHFQEVLPYYEKSNELYVENGVFLKQGAREQIAEEHQEQIEVFKKVGKYINISNLETLDQAPDAILVEIGRGMKYLAQQARENYTGDLGEKYFEAIQGDEREKYNPLEIEKMDIELQSYEQKMDYFRDLTIKVGEYIKNPDLKGEYYKDAIHQGLIGLTLESNIEDINNCLGKSIRDFESPNDMKEVVLLKDIKELLHEINSYLDSFKNGDIERFLNEKEKIETIEKYFAVENPNTLEGLPDEILVELGNICEYLERDTFKEFETLKKDYLENQYGGDKEKAASIRMELDKLVQKERNLEALTKDVRRHIKDFEVKTFYEKGAMNEQGVSSMLRADLTSVEKKLNASSVSSEKKVAELLNLKTSNILSKETADFILLLNREYVKNHGCNITAQDVMKKYKEIGKELEKNINTEIKEIFSKLENATQAIKKNNIHEIGSKAAQEINHIKDKMLDLVR